MKINIKTINKIIEEVKLAIKNFSYYAKQAYLPQDIIDEIMSNFELID